MMVAAVQTGELCSSLLSLLVYLAGSSTQHATGRKRLVATLIELALAAMGGLLVDGVLVGAPTATTLPLHIPELSPPIKQTILGGLVSGAVRQEGLRQDIWLVVATKIGTTITTTGTVASDEEGRDGVADQDPLRGPTTLTVTRALVLVQPAAGKSSVCIMEYLVTKLSLLA